MKGNPYSYEGRLEDKLADLTRITQIEEPVVRNLLITQRYHDLSHDLARVLGGDNANWSTFACWASKTAGQSIRKEEIPKELTALLQKDAKIDAHVARLYDRLGVLSILCPRVDPFDFARAVVDEVSDEIAVGNLRVYAELSPLFARFADAFALERPSSSEERRAQLSEFVASLRDGPAETGGQEDLKQAFTAYFEASTCADPEVKAQLILLGNALIGFHEQTRLQINIEGGINAPFSDKVYVCFERIRPKILAWLVRGGLREAVGVLAKEFKDDWERIATRYLMRLTAPNGREIPLGADLPPGKFDPLLENLKNRILIDFLSRFDPDLTTTKGCAAVNWTLLPDRMKFIGELFRVSQRDSKWFEQPFTDGQRAAIREGRVPMGQL